MDERVILTQKTKGRKASQPCGENQPRGASHSIKENQNEKASQPFRENQSR